ncbi:MAG TPA: peptide deformylase [Streptosporangiaceae bacterium]|jgi:peptide deformylase
MANLSIRRLGDPVLRTPAEPVTVFDRELRRLVADMFEAMYEADGMGLAAPQVGVGLRLFVYDSMNGRRGAVANPELVIDDATEVTDDEGCLSVPGVNYPLARATAATVRGQDAKGKPVEVKARGYLARCLQHETDHLDGIVYVDKLPKSLRREAMLSMD